MSSTRPGCSISGAGRRCLRALRQNNSFRGCERILRNHTPSRSTWRTQKRIGLTLQPRRNWNTADTSRTSANTSRQTIFKTHAFEIFQTEDGAWGVLLEDYIPEADDVARHSIISLMRRPFSGGDLPVCSALSL